MLSVLGVEEAAKGFDPPDDDEKIVLYRRSRNVPSPPRGEGASPCEAASVASASPPAATSTGTSGDSPAAEPSQSTAPDRQACGITPAANPASPRIKTIANPARLPEGFDVSRFPGGVSGLGLVRSLLPRRSARLAIEQEGDDVLTTVTLAPPGIRRREPA